MYVCICNAFTDKDVSEALENGSQTLPQVFRALDCRPNCGSCCSHVRGMIRDHKQANQAEIAPIAAE